MKQVVRLRAPAKVNLTLDVLGRRPDGFHELDTVVMGIGLFDELVLAVAPGERDELVVSGPAAAGVPSDGTNLVLRALGAVRELGRAAGRPVPALRIALEKRIPAQAGLGGGSSDAAAAALGACALFGLDPGLPEVLQALAELGSDCPFFLAARASGLARCTGRGERVEPWPPLALPFALALVTPGFGCATGAVYAALEGRYGAARSPLDPTQLATRLGAARSALRNDLEPAAERAHAELAAFRARLAALFPGTFRLAGSGSSCFGFFADARAAEAALAQLAADDEARRYGIRGRWVLPAASCGAVRSPSLSH